MRPFGWPSRSGAGSLVGLLGSPPPVAVIAFDLVALSQSFPWRHVARAAFKPRTVSDTARCNQMPSSSGRMQLISLRTLLQQIRPSR
jgi:hypothetical protein